jgi:ABC-2 type transport system permease protein
MKIILRDRNSLFIMLFLPMIIISVAGFALDFDDGIGINVLVVDLDNGEAAKDFVEFLEEVDVLNVDMESNEFAAREEVKNEGITLVIIPRGFTEALLQGRESELQLIVDPTQEDENTVVEQIAESYANRLATNVVAVKTVAAYGVPARDEEQILDIVEVASQFTDPSPVQVVTESVSPAAASEFTTFTQYVPGFAVMFLLFSTVQAGAVSLIIEKEFGTLRRLIIAPLSKADIIGGKIASNFIKGFLQLAVLLAFGHFVFSLNLGSDLLALMILMAAISLASTALGLLVAVLVRTKDQADSVAQLIVLVMSAIGGSWWPLFIEPQFMQDMAHLTITAWAMDGFYDLFFYDLGLPGILKEVGMLLLMATLFFITAISRFRFE